VLSARRADLAEGAFIESGKEARKAREYARAEKFFQRAADINPQSGAVWEELGTNSYLAGEYPASAAHFRMALTLEPGRAALHYFLALALEKGGDRADAAREYRRALELGGPPEARLGLARHALDEGDPGVAVDELNLLIASSPDHPEARALLSRAAAELESRRRLADVQGTFVNQRLARLEQIVADANRANRDLEARLQSLEQEKRSLETRLAAESVALAERERALESARGSVRDLALELGRGALHAQAWEPAVRYLEQVVGVDPRSREAWAGLAEAYARLGQPERSQQMLLKATALE